MEISNEEIHEVQLKPEKIADFFACLADPTRIRIMRLLETGSKTGNEVAEALNMSLPAISYQLRILRSHDIVRVARSGRTKNFSLADQHIMDILREGITHILHNKVEEDQDDTE
jgi:ArsR family transcriptional regulator